jgi:hypothetical protein
MPGSDSRVGVWPLVSVWALSVAAYAGKAAYTAATTPLILDGDDAMRLNEVRDLLAGQGWFDLVQHRLDTPFGTELHWSRLVDAPEALLLLVLRPLAGAGAETLAAYVWPALLLLILLWVTARLALRLGGSAALWPALLLTPFSLITIGEFAPGRFDHHSLQILLSIAIVYCAVAALERPRFALGAGAASALALSIGIEGLPVAAAAAMVFCLLWVAASRHAAAMRDFGLSFAVGCVLGLAQGAPPAEWLTVRIDQISIVYVAASVLCALAFLLLSSLSLASRPARLAAAILTGVFAVGLLVGLDPSLLRGPYAALDPWLVRNWLAHVAEAQSWVQSFREDPVYPAAVTIPALVALGWALANAAANRSRGPWLIVAAFLAVGMLVMLVQIRAARLVTPLAVPASAALIAALWRQLADRPRASTAAALAAAVVASAGLAVAVIVAVVPLPATASRGNARACLEPQAFAALARLPRARVMAPIDLGSHLLLFTPHSVVGAPYHRDQRGLLDTLRFFDGPVGQARSILEARGIDLVVVCPAMAEFNGVVAADPDSFAALYGKGELPPWLERAAPAPGPLEIYRVKAR